MPVLAVLLAALLGLCAGQKPCCTPDQWEGTIQELQGFLVDDKLGLVDGNVTISYDFTNKKLALTENLNETGTGMIKLTIIQDYNKGFQYAIQGDQCRKTFLLGHLDQLCIADNSTHLGSFTYGGMASGGLEVDSFMEANAGSNNFYSITDVTRDGCIPVSKVEVNLQREHSTITSQLYTDVTTGIKDPSVFTPPVPPCSNNDKVMFEDTAEPGSDFFKSVLRSFQQHV